MLESLADVLKPYGLDLNMKKTKIMSTVEASEENIVCITKYGPMDILGTKSRHKYLGRAFSGDLKTRGENEIDHRLACAWMKYRSLQHVFEDKYVSIKLRLKLFESVVSSTLLYGLETAPLTESLLHRIDVVQRTMLRRIIGWVCYNDDTWEERGRQMAGKLQRCLVIYPVKTWSEAVNARKVKVFECIDELPFWTRASIKWSPFDCTNLNLEVPYRAVGRPYQRWDDNASNGDDEDDVDESDDDNEASFI